MKTLLNTIRLMVVATLIGFSTTACPAPERSPPASIPLTVNKWADGNLTADSIDWYSFSVTGGTAYQLWWNERGGSSYGDGTKTGDVRVNAYYSNETAIFNNVNSAWSAPYSFTANSDDTVYVRVTSTYTGTYGIVYSTGTTRPPTIHVDVPSNATPLTESVWENGNLPNADSVDWYSISVMNGTTYRLWWNDDDSGNNTKTGDIKVSVVTSEGVVSIADRDSSWSGTITSFMPSYTGTVYVKVVPYDRYSYGTYGIVYSTGTTRPPIPIDVPSSAIPLIESEWEDANLPTTNSVDWYSIEVTNGTTYRLWWNDKFAGNGTKTADVTVSVVTNNGVALSITYRDSSWSGTPASFIPTYTGIAYVKVEPYNSSSNSTGTYGIVYSTGTTRPLIAFDAPSPTTSLTESVWKNGDLPTVDSVDWYSISVISGTSYRLWWNEGTSLNGDGTKTGAVWVSVVTNEGTMILHEGTGAWSMAKSFTPTYTGTAYVKVTPFNSTFIGTYGIVYSSTSTTRPAP